MRFLGITVVADQHRVCWTNIRDNKNLLSHIYIWHSGNGILREKAEKLLKVELLTQHL